MKIKDFKDLTPEEEKDYLEWLNENIVKEENNEK